MIEDSAPGGAETPSLRPDPTQLEPLRRAGLRLIPLHKHDSEIRRNKKLEKLGKEPRDSGWPDNDYSDFDFDEHMESDGNVGVQCDGLVVVDHDPRNHNEDDDPLVRMKEAGLLAADAPRVRTGGGGTHIYMRMPAGVEARDLTAKLRGFDGIDIKRGRGYVVAPGSVHPNTKRHYRIDGEFGPIPEAPKALIDALTKVSDRTSDAEPGAYTPEQLAEMLAGLNAEDFRDHEDWLQLMMACNHATGGAGREEFVSWCIEDNKFRDDAEIIRNRWDSLKPDGGVTYKTLIYQLNKAGRNDLVRAPVDQEGGWQPDFDLTKGGLAKDTQRNAIEAMRDPALMPVYDELKGEAVFESPNLPWNESYGRKLDDHTILLLIHYLITRHAAVGYDPKKDRVFDAVRTIAFEHKRNPVISYLDGLEWDGVKRAERLFPDYFGVPDSAYARAVSLCFMVGAVRRQKQPGCKFDTMPILKSDRQGVGKSTGIRALFHGEWTSDASLGDIRGKDAVQLLQGIWVQELAELDGLRATDINRLKAFCSTQVDRVRLPYGRSTSDLPRRCVFIGTCNEGGYILDQTGGRRFWPLEVQGEIDVQAIIRDRDQLWAEAVHLEAAGASVVLPRELWGDAAERQAAETTSDPWRDTLSAFADRRLQNYYDHAMGEGEYSPEHRKYMGDEPPPPPDRIHTSELFAALEVPSARQMKGAASRIRGVMESLGWKYKPNIRIGARSGAGYELT